MPGNQLGPTSQNSVVPVIDPEGAGSRGGDTEWESVRSRGGGDLVLDKLFILGKEMEFRMKDGEEGDWGSEIDATRTVLNKAKHAPRKKIFSKDGSSLCSTF